VLFLLLSGFFLAALIGAVERSRRLLAVAGTCLVVLVCIIVFVKPVQLPSISQLIHKSTSTTVTTAPPGADSTGTTQGTGQADTPANTTTT
jgi:hypothetical protein